MGGGDEQRVEWRNNDKFGASPKKEILLFSIHSGRIAKTRAGAPVPSLISIGMT